MNSSWNCITLNEHIYGALSDFMENKTDDLQSRTASLRDAASKEAGDSLTRKSKQDQTEIQKVLVSEYRHKFYAPCKPISIDRREIFDQIFKNQGFGEELLMDHKGLYYDSNYVTTYDLTLNHLKKGICGPISRRYSRGKYVTPSDLTTIYPSLTNWGSKERVYKKKEKMMRKPSKAVSEYKSEYSCN